MNLLKRGRGKLIFLMLSSVAVVALAACAGDDGSQGVQGPAGQPGFPGNAGLSGEPGTAGNPGAAGNPGNPGSPGEPGEPGAPGEPGNAGANGANGAQGIAGPAGPTGSDGGNANHTSLIVVDAGTGSAGFVEFKAAGTTEANVVGAGFLGTEVVALRVTTVGADGRFGTVVLAEVTANGAGAFSVTVDLSNSAFSAGSVHTLDALGEDNNATGGFAIVDKVATD